MIESFEKAKELSDMEYLYFLVQPICEFEVRISRRVDELGVLLSIDASASDMGYIIGKKGATVNAMRGLLRVFGASRNERINLKINEPEGRERVAQKPSQDER